MKIAFLDRDGVLNVDYGHVGTAERLVLFSDSFLALRRLADWGYALIIVTNQSGIARGYYTEEDFHVLMREIVDIYRAQKIEILDYFYCPHHPEFSSIDAEKDCECRKPRPDMVMSALKKYGVPAHECILIGDKQTDISCAKNAGIEKNFLLERKTANKNDESFLNLVRVITDEKHD